MTEIETLKDTEEIKDVKKKGRPIKPDSVHHDVEQAKVKTEANYINHC